MPRHLTTLFYDEPLRGMGRVRAERRMEHESTRETRSFLLSFPAVKTFAYAVRSHWGMENSLHSRA
jgi:predicted transposase YbfD/YdcC